MVYYCLSWRGIALRGYWGNKMPGFTSSQWQKIDTELGNNPNRYGLPIRRNKSVVIGSFNALKLGSSKNADKRWEFLRNIASRFDLLAIQEVMDELSGIRRLHQSLGSSYRLVVSDTTGAFPGDPGLRERLAFLYRPSRIELRELVSDISYDRSRIVETVRVDIDTWKQFFHDIDHENELRVQEGKKPKSLSQYAHPAFTTFIRTPHCASFAIKPRGNAKPVEFLAINAHTLYGKSKTERNREFFALLDWIIQRARSSKRMYFKNMIVMGDLNMQFGDATIRRSEIIQKLHQLESNLLTGDDAARANFPFLDVHPSMQSLFHTNARKKETFDHIALFIDEHEKGLPTTTDNRQAGQNGKDGYDYGVFDFTELFSQVIHGKLLDDLSSSQISALLSRVNADVSDHMPIWARIPIPGV